MPKISCVIPTVRNVDLNLKCLERQTFTDFEIIVTRPEGKKPEGLFYTLNRDYNRAFRQSKGELIISYQDNIEIRPDCLDRFWYWHEYHKGKACIGAVGDQYSSLNPPVKVWIDPRRSDKYGTHYEIIPLDLEYSLCAIPKQALVDVNFLDPEFDKYAALSEKEMNYRMDKLGYKFYISQDIEYKAIKHPRLSEDWDKHYFAGIPYYQKCLEEIDAGSRLCLDFVK